MFFSRKAYFSADAVPDFSPFRRRDHQHRGRGILNTLAVSAFSITQHDCLIQVVPDSATYPESLYEEPKKCRMWIP